MHPRERLTLSNEFHSLRLSNANDPWHLGGGAFQPWACGYTGRASGGARSLAGFYDMQADLRVSQAVSVTGYFGYVQGVAVMKAIYPPGKNGRLGFLEFTYLF